MAETAPTQVLPVVEPAPTEPFPIVPPGPEPIVGAPIGPEPAPIPAPTEPVPITRDDLSSKLLIQLGDVSRGVVAEAADSGDEHVRQQTTQGGVVGFAKKIWHGNIARDYVRQRAVNRSRNEIITEQNLYASAGGDRNDHNQAMAAVVTRLTSEYDLLHEGERNDFAHDVQGGEQLENQLKELVSNFAQGDIDYDQLEAQRVELVRNFGAEQRASTRDRNRGLLYADNITEVARNARAAFEHGVGLANIDAALGLKIADVQVGARTAASREAADRIVDWVASKPGLRLVNEATVVSVAGIVMSATKYSTKRLSSALLRTGTLGLGSGVIAGAREFAHVKQERQHHTRQMAEGGAVEASTGRHRSRREKMEATRYQTVHSTELLGQLQAASDEHRTNQGLGSLSRLLQAVTETQTRITMSDDLRADLITYDSKLNIEQQRLELDIELAQAKVTLQQFIDTTTPDRLQDLGIENRPIDEIITANSDLLRQAIEGDMSEKDRAFRHLRTSRVLASVAMGTVLGAGIGAAVQEGTSLFEHSVQGVFEHGNKGEHSRTELAALFGHKGPNTIENHADANFANSAYHDGNNALDLPKGFHIITNSHTGAKELVDAQNKVVAGHVGFDKNGSLNAATIGVLQHEGFKMHTTTEAFQTTHMVTETVPHVETQTVSMSPEDYIAAHPEQFTTIHRELWYDNNTPYPDHNELDTDWGGVNGSGIDTQGNFVLNVANMTPGGSFEGSQSADYATLIANHQLALAVSLDTGSQSHVVLVPFDANGNATMDANNPIFQSVFANENGHAVFNGGYAEVVQITNQSPQGTDVNILSTVVGSNQPGTVNETVSNTVNETVQHAVAVAHEHVITHIEAPKPADLRVEVTPVFPIRARRGLEDLSEAGPAINPDYYYGYNSYYPYNAGAPRYNWSGEIIPPAVAGLGAIEEAEQRRNLAPFAPELEDDPDGNVPAGVVVRRYLSSLSPTYRREVREMARSMERQSKAASPKVVVIIPAAAHQEGANIYRTLQQYAKQTDVDPDDFEVVVFANYPEDARRDKTISEIRRFQAAGTGINVRYMERALPPKEANIGNIRKLATDTVIQDLSDRGVDFEDVMLVSNDADSYWIDPRYLRTIIDRSVANPETDGFMGFIDWSHDAYKAHPEILVGTRFMQMIDMYLRRTTGGVGSSGANFAFRPKIYTAVGGYKVQIDKGEDIGLGRMIKAVRSGGNTRRPIAYLGRSAEINTSARRAVDHLLKSGGAPIMQWNGIFSPNDALRNQNFDLTPFDFSDPARNERLIEASELVLNETLSVYLNDFMSTSPYHDSVLARFDTKALRQLGRMLWAIGVEPAWQPDGSFKIANGQRMIENMQRWQAAH